MGALYLPIRKAEREEEIMQLSDDVETQRRDIRMHLLSGYGISHREALDLYGCFRLAAVVAVLRDKYEMQISSYWDVHVNSKGKKKRFKVYYLTEYGESYIRMVR